MPQARHISAIKSPHWESYRPNKGDKGYTQPQTFSKIGESTKYSTCLEQKTVKSCKAQIVLIGFNKVQYDPILNTGERHVTFQG